MPNLVFLTYPKPTDIEQNLDGGIFNFHISGQSIIKRNCHNSRTNHDIDMTLGTITKLDKKNKTVVKKLTMMSCRKIVTSLLFFEFKANLEQCGT